jgi:hypothetical protein
MRASSEWLVAGVAMALAIILAVFGWVRQEFGPGDRAAPAFIRTYICANAACGRVVRVTPDEEKEMGLDPWDGPGLCPTCGQMTLRRAERCTSCGELVPSPPPGQLLGAKCPVCKKDLFGPLGGVWPYDPQRPKRSEEEADEDAR